MPYTQLLTRVQLNIVLVAWGISKPAPTKKQKLLVNFAGDDYNLAVITQSALKSTYGKRLFEVKLTKEKEKHEKTTSKIVEKSI